MSFPDSISYLELPRPSRRLAYSHKQAASGKPTLFFLNGFHSDMGGEKVQFLKNFFAQGDTGFLAFDYSGHGQSSGNIQDGTITQWLQDTLDIINYLSLESIILAGSSMGGWLALLTALNSPQRIKALIGIAAAPDFTQELMWNKFSPAQQQEVIHSGKTVIHNEYSVQGWTITNGFVESGRQHLVLGGSIKLDIPVRLLHGMEDTIVPFTYSQKLVELIAAKDVTLTLIKSGNHRLSRPEDLLVLRYVVDEILDVSGYGKSFKEKS